jgi:hypothetical protein
MLRALLFVMFAATAAAQGNGTTTQQCGPTNPCPSPSGSPSALASAAPSRLPCCIDPARCAAGQLICPTPTPSPVSPPPCCTVNCTVGQPICNYSPAPTPMRTPMSTPLQTQVQTPKATERPTEAPTERPTEAPTEKPTEAPTERPTERPSQEPTRRPTEAATERPSQEPTERPSQEPTRRPTELPTERPTQIPVRPSQDPTKRPSVIPSRLPAASLLFRPQQSVAPSTFPVRPRVSPLANVTALGGILQFPNANTTALQQPAAVQQIVANLACALRAPLENILLRNITQTTAAGAVVIPFNATLVSLNSNGTVVCYAPMRNATAPRLLRGRSLESAGTVSIDYLLVDPAPGLLTMDTTTFETTVAADPAVQDIAATLESSGVTAVAPAELQFVAAPSAEPNAGSPAPSNTLSVQIGSIVGGIVAAFVVGGVVVGVVMQFALRRPVVATVVKPASSAVVIVQNTEAAPAEANRSENPMLKAQDGRQMFDPQAVRTRV